MTKTLKYLLGVCAVSLCFIVQNRDDPGRIAAQEDLIYTPYFYQQTECLAKAIYFEASGESEVGKKAVAKVVLNRTADPEFPKSICGVVHERTGKLCQFSWVCNPPKRKIDNVVWNESWELAKNMILHPQSELPYLGEALFFHAKYVSPDWSGRTKIATIGRHIFYTK